MKIHQFPPLPRSRVWVSSWIAPYHFSPISIMSLGQLTSIYVTSLACAHLSPPTVLKFWFTPWSHRVWTTATLSSLVYLLCRYINYNWYKTLQPVSLLKKNSISHITPVLQQLHWLPIKYCIIYKILLLTFKAINNLGPSVSYRAPPYQDTHPFSQIVFLHPAHPPSSPPGYHGVKSIQSLSPPTSLPHDIKHSSASSIFTFKSHLKTYLFSQAYSL